MPAKFRPPLRFCDECRFAELRPEGDDVRLLCAHNHTPPFVVPDWPEIASGKWGWMRRCSDFEPGAKAPAIARKA